MSATVFFKVMQDFVQAAGVEALALIGDSHPELKADRSVITRADRRISAMAHERLSGFIKAGGHALVDEEDPARADAGDDRFWEEHPFVWALDPIDATRAYANGMPHYGISLGLLKDRSPWLGAVYFPSLSELFIADGTEAWFVRAPFTPAETRVRIVPQDDVISDRSVFIATDDLLTKFRWVNKECRVMVLAAAVCEFCWPAIGRGCGSLSRVHVWDMAGSWPIFEKAGLKMRALADGRPLDRLDRSLFEPKNASWRFKDYYILSSERNYPLLKDSLQASLPL